MSTLRAIVYVSAATQLMSVAQLESLLVAARDLNRASGVTGVLLYSDGSFIQCIEGADDVVQLTYQRIRASRRHKNIVELLDDRIVQRSFPDWLMGFAQPTRSELLSLSTARWQRLASEVPGGGAASPGLSLLQGFWKNTRR